MSLCMGDKFQELYRQTYGRTISYLRNHFRFSEEEARELAQDVFLSVFEQMQNSAVTPSWAYVKTAAHNRAVNAIRARLVRRKSDATDISPVLSDQVLHDFWTDLVPSSPEDAAIMREQSLLLRTEIERLSPEIRAVVLLWLDGRTYQQIAEVLRVTVPVVHHRLQQAKKHLRQATYQSTSLDHEATNRASVAAYADDRSIADDADDDTDLAQLESELQKILNTLQQIRLQELRLLQDIAQYAEDLKVAGDWARSFHHTEGLSGVSS